MKKDLLGNHPEKGSEFEEKTSSKQKGNIVENRAIEIITLTSNGKLTCYSPNSDDDGIDLIVKPKSEFKPIFLQVKSRFKLQKNNQFHQNVGIKTFQSDKHFYLLFIYFPIEKLEVEKLWLIPSNKFRKLAYEKKAGKTYKSFYRFSANPFSSENKWAKYIIEKNYLGKRIYEIIRKNY